MLVRLQMIPITLVVGMNMLAKYFRLLTVDEALTERLEFRKHDGEGLKVSV